MTHRVSLQSSYPNFEKKICLAKNGGHFEFSNFSQKLQNIKNAYISKTLLDRAISTKFLTHRVYLQSSHANFQKNFVSPKMAAILNFRIFRKNAKHKNAYISKTLLDRAIFTKFLTRRVSLQSSHANFQTNNFSPKMAAILNFRIFRNIPKLKNAYISKTVLDRAISTKFLTHWAKHKNANISKTVLHRAISKKISGYLCRAAIPKSFHLNFRIFAQKLQNTKMLIFRKPCYIERFRRNFLSSGYLCRAAITPKSFHLVKFQTHS